MNENHKHTWKIDNTILESTNEGTNMREVAYLICNECKQVEKSIVHPTYFPTT